MKNWIQPSRRYRDVLQNQGYWYHMEWLRDGHTEVELTDEHVEEFLSGDAGAWEDLVDTLKEHEVLHLTPYIYATTEFKFFHQALYDKHNQRESGVTGFIVDGPDEYPVIYVGSPREFEPDMTRMHQKLARLQAATSVENTVGISCYGLKLNEDRSSFRVWEPSMVEYYLKANQHHKLVFERCRFSEPHCQILGRFQGALTFDKTLLECTWSSYLQGDPAEKSGPKEITLHRMKTGPEGVNEFLRDSKTLGKCTIYQAERWNFYKFPKLLTAVGQNTGPLKEFSLKVVVSETTLTPEWDAAFQALFSHKTLEKITLRYEHLVEEEPAAGRVRRAKLVALAMKRNKVLRELDIEPGFFDEQILRNEILPKIQANDYRPRIGTIAKEETNKRVRLAVFQGALTQNAVISQDSSLLWTTLNGFQEEFLAQVKKTSEEESSNKRQRKCPIWRR